MLEQQTTEKKARHVTKKHSIKRKPGDRTQSCCVIKNSKRYGHEKHSGKRSCQRERSDGSEKKEWRSKPREENIEKRELEEYQQQEERDSEDECLHGFCFLCITNTCRSESKVTGETTDAR